MRMAQCDSKYAMLKLPAIAGGWILEYRQLWRVSEAGCIAENLPQSAEKHSAMTRWET